MIEKEEMIVHTDFSLETKYVASIEEERGKATTTPNP